MIKVKKSNAYVPVSCKKCDLKLDDDIFPFCMYLNKIIESNDKYTNGCKINADEYDYFCMKKLLMILKIFDTLKKY